MALFTTVEALAKYIPSIVDIEEDQFSSMFEKDLVKAERDLKLELLGGVYVELDNDDYLKGLCESVVAYTAAVRFIPQIDLLLTESGFAVTSNSNQSPASKERVERLIATCKDNSGESVESLFLYLESNEDYLSAWQEAKIYTRFDDMPCATNKEFTQYAIGWGKRYSIDFYYLHPKMIEAREQFIKPKIGEDFYAFILANPDDEKILPFIHNLRQAYASAVMGNHRSAEKIMSNVWSYIIENRTEYPDFDKWYSAPEEWENSEDDNIVAFGI